MVVNCAFSPNKGKPSLFSCTEKGRRDDDAVGAADFECILHQFSAADGYELDVFVRVEPRVRNVRRVPTELVSLMEVSPKPAPFKSLMNRIYFPR